MKSLIALSLLAVPVSALAQPQTATTVRVSYADLDLSRAADRAALDRRIDKALDQVCPADRPGYLTPSPEALRCQAIARQQIVAARQQALAQRGGAVRISANP